MFSALLFPGTMLHSSLKARISENPKSGRKIARVLVIYTGGTIGMKKNSDDCKLLYTVYIYKVAIILYILYIYISYYIYSYIMFISTFYFDYLGYEVVPNYFAEALKKLPMLYDEEYVNSDAQEITPIDNNDSDLPYNKYPELVMP